nr:hypothetical protein [Ensifer sp. IC4062]
MALILGSGSSADIHGPDWLFDFDKEVGFEATDPFNVAFQFSVETGCRWARIIRLVLLRRLDQQERVRNRGEGSVLPQILFPHSQT